MTTRRGNGEGTIRQRSDGRWEAQLSLPGGKRKSVYGKTKKEAREGLKVDLKKLDDGVDHCHRLPLGTSVLCCATPSIARCGGI